MKPVKTVCVFNDQTKFEVECERLIKQGYYLDSSSSGIEQDNVCFNAVLVLPVSIIAEAATSTSDNNTRSAITLLVDEVYSLKIVLGEKSWKHLDLLASKMEKISQQQPL